MHDVLGEGIVLEVVALDIVLDRVVELDMVLDLEGLLGMVVLGGISRW